jgi:hypothetical protein
MATREESAERTRFCLDLLMRGQSRDGTVFHPSVITRMCASKFGISTRSCWRYLSRASKAYSTSRAIAAGVHALWISDVLANLIAKPTESTKDRLKAIEQYMRLHGLDLHQIPEAAPEAPKALPDDDDDFIKLLERAKPKAPPEADGD